MSACLSAPSLVPSVTLPAAPLVPPPGPALASGALEGAKPGALSALAPDSFLFLRLAQQAVEVDGPGALARWWRGALQALLPHRALLVTPLHQAAPAGVPQWLGDAPWRGEAAACALAAPLALAWASHGHRPCRVTPADLPRAEGLGDGCWIHGLRGRRLFAFFGVPHALDGRSEETVRQSIALLVPLLDAALRGAGEGGSGAGPTAPGSGPGSAREVNGAVNGAVEGAAGAGGLGGGWRPAAGEALWQAAVSPPITMRRCPAGALSERERQIMLQPRSL